MPVTRKAIYVHYCLTCRLNCHEIPKFSPTNAPLVMKRINQMYKKSKQNDATRKFKRREKTVNFCCSTCKMDELERFKTFRENNQRFTVPSPHFLLKISL